MKIVSGGQTGVDRGALEAARKSGVETGGFAPKGYLTERGFDLALKEFNLVDSGKSYFERTNLNALNSDGTIWFGGMSNTPGYAATKQACQQAGKIFLNISRIPPEDAALMIKSHDWVIINVAGPRESVSQGIQAKSEKYIVAMIRELKTRFASLFEFSEYEP